MANVLKDEKKQQIIALGRLGWSLRKIKEATRVRRETISAYLRGAGVEIWPPGRLGIEDTPLGKFAELQSVIGAESLPR